MLLAYVHDYRKDVETMKDIASTATGALFFEMRCKRQGVGFWRAKWFLNTPEMKNAVNQAKAERYSGGLYISPFSNDQ